MSDFSDTSGDFCSPIEAAADLADGQMVVVVDDRDGENDGDLLLLGESATTESINFMAREARGLICLALPHQRCVELGLKPMVPRRSSSRETDFTVSIEAATGVSTGISAGDRAHTVRVAVDPDSGPDSLVRPGHIFPLRARPGRLLERRGHTEAAVDLALMAGGNGAAVICQILDDDGNAATVSSLPAYAGRHGIKSVRLDDLVAERFRTGSKTLGDRAAAGLR